MVSCAPNAFPPPNKSDASPDVRLSKLKLAGFKTFVDPTTVVTPGNLVGVVGPNGCGKSNIIDAVRWVLGETRASALRGESMQDVIFNGSTTRKPVSRASVELVFDNAEGRAAGQWSRYAEISVKRVLDRSGESTYYINNVHVRRKDVIDLFLGTGLGPRAYAIIEQGMISRIIEARPEDIRGFLEEAAGVTKYRERRKETEGRLSDARDNLARLDDIRTELGERIERLTVQAAVAQRFRELSATHTQRQHLLWLLKRNEALDERDRLQAALNELSRRMEADSARLQELEAEVEAVREAHFAASEATHAAQTDLFAISAEVSRLEGEIRHLSDARTRLNARLEELERERLQWGERRTGLQDDQSRWRELLENATLRVAQAEARHDEVATALPEAESLRRNSEATASAARRELSQTEQQLRVEEANRASARRTLEALETRRQRIAAEQAAIEAPDELEIARSEAQLDALGDSLQMLEQHFGELQARAPEAQAALKQALDHERQAQRAVTELRARRDALLQLQAKVQSQGKLGDWLKRHRLESLAPLWKSLRVEAGWETAVEAALRERLGALTGDVAAAVAAVLDETPPESLAVVLPAGVPDGAATSIPHLTDIPALRGRVHATNPQVAALLDEWLAGFHVADTLTGWMDRAAELPPGVVLVSQAGQLLSRSALVHFAASDRTHGVMERQREIDTLAEEQAAREELAHLAHDALIAAEADAEDVQQRVAEHRRELQLLQQRRHDAQVEHLKLVQARQRAEERSERVTRDLADVAHQEEQERAHLSRAELEFERFSELAELQRQRLAAADELLAEHDRALRETRTLEQAMARELQEARFSERECTAKLDEIQRNLALADEQLRRLEEEAHTREQELSATDTLRSSDALQEALALRQRRETALAACRDQQEQIAARLKQTEEARLRTEQEAGPARNQVGELRLAVQAAELAAAQFAERLVEASADEASLLPLLTADLRETSLQRDVNRLAREIAELGQVNLAALDELSSASERKGYLDAQYEDLTQAILTLEDAIRRIDRETREQLQETYNTVTRQFGTLFPQLFGGGQARLVLTGDEILDAGIQIVAQPPGKKNTSIHLLSGGEKALTAIALVFAMFQLNPAPFCMLDEVDAPLDDANTERYCQMVKRMSSQTQFVFISHSKITMEIAEQLVGVTMQEQGVSRVVEVDIEEALRMAEPAPA
ncbi:MAG: chromosome segregation protein SMC [Rhodocyclaceae bacterium]